MECEYAVHNRSTIHDATVCGTGFLKGPIPLAERIRKSWMRDDGGHYRLQNDPESEGRFAFQHVSYWHLFPETNCRSFDRCTSWFERHVATERDLRDLADQPGVDRDAIRRILDEGPSSQIPEFMLQLDAIDAEEVSTYARNVYIVWEYRGPLDRDEMEMLMSELVQAATDGDQEPVSVEVDPLLQMDAVLLFCQGEALRWGINPHGGQRADLQRVSDRAVAVAGLWGVGIPYLLRSQAAIINDAWRGMMENAAFAALPQFEIDTNVVQRPDGEPNRIEPGGVWERTKTSDSPGLILHPVPVQQDAYGQILELAMRLVDMETNVSILASGEQGAHTTRTAGGIGLLMNAVNVVFRRVVKNFDDGITSTAITRAYHFLMDFSDREEIKGDYTVHARGSAVLLVREIQAQNLMTLMQMAGADPELGEMLKKPELTRKLMQSMMVESDGVMKTQAELEADMAARQEAEAQGPPPPEMIALQLEQQKLEIEQQRMQMQAQNEQQKMQMQSQLSQMETQSKMQLAAMQIEADLTKMAAQGQITMAEVQARLQGLREQTQSKERIFAAEAAVEAQKPADGNGSGGYIS